MKDPKLSPHDAVVIFADLQGGIVDLPLTVPRSKLARAAGALARLAELFDIPTFALTLPKRDGGHAGVIPEITTHRSRVRHIRRSRPDSFENVEFARAIEDTGRRTLLVCGIATEIVVHWLVLSGLANGYRVHVVVDACGGLGVRSEEAALRRFEAAGAVMTSVYTLCGEFAGDIDSPTGHAAVEICYELIAPDPGA